MKFKVLLTLVLSLYVTSSHAEKAADPKEWDPNYPHKNQEQLKGNSLGQQSVVCFEWCYKAAFLADKGPSGTDITRNSAFPPNERQCDGKAGNELASNDKTYVAGKALIHDTFEKAYPKDRFCQCFYAPVGYISSAAVTKKEKNMAQTSELRTGNSRQVCIQIKNNATIHDVDCPKKLLGFDEQTTPRAIMARPQCDGKDSYLESKNAKKITKEKINAFLKENAKPDKKDEKGNPVE